MHNDKKPPEPLTERRLLNPIERISEILFGLIMALTFTCTVSVINSDRTEIRDMLFSSIGCNIAWGLVDAVMYLLMTITERGRGLNILNFIRQSKNTQKAHRFISDSLPPVISSVMKSEDLESIRKKILGMKDFPSVVRLSTKDIKIALGIFSLVFLSTFPVVIPFIIIEDTHLALRTSNMVAIFLMYLCGAQLGKYAGHNRFIMGALMSLIGVALVLITIYLGG